MYMSAPMKSKQVKSAASSTYLVSCSPLLRVGVAKEDTCFLVFNGMQGVTWNNSLMRC